MMVQDLIQYEYDVALSFAGQDRSYAQNLADALRQRGIEVFYDEYEQDRLWGEDLYQHLSDLYTNQARYCIVFLSQNYIGRRWAQHELQCAQARAFRDNTTYILPIRLDNTSIPGIPETVGYLYWHNYSFEDITNIIIRRLNRQTLVYIQIADSSQESNANQLRGVKLAKLSPEAI